MKVKDLISAYSGDLYLKIFDDLAGCIEFEDFAKNLPAEILDETVLSFRALGRNYLKIVI